MKGSGHQNKNCLNKEYKVQKNILLSNIFTCEESSLEIFGDKALYKYLFIKNYKYLRKHV